MAQLIKLQDYISRYETDIYRYPGQFIRLKKENWGKLLDRWEQEYAAGTMELQQEKIEESNYTRKRFSIRELFKGKKEENTFTPFPAQHQDSYLPPKDKETLKYDFLDHIFKFQLKWASSTIREYSTVDDKFRTDASLRYFLQRFPDTFLVMYKPVFQLQKASVEADIILITPVQVICLTVINENEKVTLLPEDGRTWFKELEGVQTRMLSPMIGLKRTENIVKSILNKYSVDIPISKVILSRNNKIKFQSEPYKTEYIGREQYQEWFEQLRSFTSPLKHIQLKTAEALLKDCHSVFTQRPEWFYEDDPTVFDF
ncbi:NERD domain-containing protein [Virgibacillus sp. MSP4-1]|uniref:hypothetical protein n=1 Tax=Virgibacillus sp. MSP4-1 TaxID=2700081 RepID=UPI0003A32C9D|nr:hypothetical protein [Virgibacillus sp. MSP4-1]QHS23069.1 NERD domain-containing protein [Virgibacillus sp. MSP4-1]